METEQLTRDRSRKVLIGVYIGTLTFLISMAGWFGYSLIRTEQEIEILMMGNRNVGASTVGE